VAVRQFFSRLLGASVIFIVFLPEHLFTVLAEEGLQFWMLAPHMQDQMGLPGALFSTFPTAE
jgi:hypothetical protein